MPKIAILHDDQSVAARASACAERLNLDAVRISSTALLWETLSKGGVDAVLLDVVGGGFELIEKVCERAPDVSVIVVTELDSKTVQSTERLVRAKKLNVSIIRAGAFDQDTLKAAINTQPRERTDITVTNLQDSIEQKFLRVEYQPKVPFDPESGAGCSVEALVRLRHPRLGDVYPDQFISVAEKSGLIEDLTDSVTSQVFEDLAKWREAGLRVTAAINVSPLLLNDGAWSARFLERCEQYGVGPQDVTLEITESSMGAENTAALDVLTRLRLKGYTLSIDDFGTGFSSLANLYKLPFSELKLDKSFVMDLGTSEEAHALIETTVSMARRIGLKVVAEGVETEAAFEQLRSFGCDYAQGYYISRPMPAERVPEFFAEWSGRAEALTDRTEALAAPAASKVGAVQALLDAIMSAAPEESDETLVLDSGGDDGFAPAAPDPVHEVVRRIPSLVMKGQTLNALSACHEARLCLESGGASARVAERLLQLERLLERDLLDQQELVELAFAGGETARLIGGKPVVMGRGAPGGSVDIPTACRWFSRGERNLRVSPQDHGWLVEDLGSTNGKLMNGAPLAPGQSAPLPMGVTELRIGREAESCPPVSLTLECSPRDPEAVRMRIAVDADRIEAAASEIGWTGWEKEAARLWVALADGGRASIGSAEGCAIAAPGAQAPVAMQIEYDGGFWLIPAAGAPVVVDGHAFHRRVPLAMGATVIASGVSMDVRAARNSEGAAETSHAPMASSA